MDGGHDDDRDGIDGRESVRRRRDRDVATGASSSDARTGTARASEARDADGVPRPRVTSELLPSRLLSVAEFVMVPFFWLAPLSLLVLGGAMALDLQRTGTRLEERYDADDPFDAIAYLWCATPFVVAHLGTLVYRVLRVTKIREARGLSSSAFTRQVARRNPSSGRAVGGAFGIQLVGLAALFFPADGLDLLSVLGLVSLACGLLIAPVAVWYDLRSVRRIDHVDWGWPRYLHVASGWLPGAPVVYLVCRRQQVQLATLIDVWTVDPASIEPAPEEKTRLERVDEWIEEAFRPTSRRRRASRRCTARR